jgi:hypothetical protein
MCWLRTRSCNAVARTRGTPVQFDVAYAVALSSKPCPEKFMSVLVFHVTAFAVVSSRGHATPCELRPGAVASARGVISVLLV